MSVWMYHVNVIKQRILLLFLHFLSLHVPGPLKCQRDLCSAACELTGSTYLNPSLPLNVEDGLKMGTHFHPTLPSTVQGRMWSRSPLNNCRGGIDNAYSFEPQPNLYYIWEGES